jgi:hypothetical protein
MVFWNTMLCSLVAGYWCFIGTYCHYFLF